MPVPVGPISRMFDFCSSTSCRVLRVVVVDPLVVVVDGDGELLLGPLLADDVEVEELLDLFRLRKLAGAFHRARLVLAVLGDDVEADVDALVADVDRRARRSTSSRRAGLVAEAATQDVAAVPLLRHVPIGSFLEVVRFYAAPS